MMLNSETQKSHHGSSTHINREKLYTNIKVNYLNRNEVSVVSNQNNHFSFEKKKRENMIDQVYLFSSNDTSFASASSTQPVNLSFSTRINSHNQTIDFKRRRDKTLKERRRRSFCPALCVICTCFYCLLLAVFLASFLIPSANKNNPTTATSTTSTTTTSATTTTTTERLCGDSCLNKTWISSAGLLAKWTFDGVYTDETSTYTVIPVNTPTFYSNGYVRNALNFNAATSDYCYTSYIPLIGASFTIEVWLYPTGYPNLNDHSILGLCTSLGLDHCLHITIRLKSGVYCLYFSFDGDQIWSSHSVPLNQWTHAAFTFDLTTSRMTIYQDGILIAYGISVYPLRGTPNSVTIGYIPLIVSTYGNNFYQGLMDEFTISNRAKSACEILADATLATYYKFDINPNLIDSGPNLLSSISSDVSFVSSGLISNALSLDKNTSYLQINDLVGLGTINKPFSISLWIRPYVLSGALVYIVASLTPNSWCIPFLGFSTSTTLIAQMLSGSIQSVSGPANLSLSTWHHIVQTWNATNQLRLYVDNELVGSNTAATSYTASSQPTYVRIGSEINVTCSMGNIDSQTSFQGDIDEFRIYSRELSADDVCALYRYR